MRNNVVWSDFLYYWLLAVLILFTVGSAYLLAPLLVVEAGIISYLLTGFLASIYGGFVVIFVHDLDEITHHHHIGVFATMLVGSLASFVVLWSGLSGELAPGFRGVGLALTFSAFFFFPYLLYIGYQKK